MATSTILRVKRRLEDNPQDALVLMCKRMKTDAEEISPSLFVFRGTVDNEETVQVKNIAPTKSNANLKPVRNVDDIIQKIRKERKETSTENRYEVVNCSRGLKENNDKDSNDIFDLVDLRQKSEVEEADVQYAYDLYTTAMKDFDISMIDNLVSIENYETDLIFGSYRDNGRVTPSSDGADDDDDSNDENNWRNDYPDSEPSSIDEEDMIKAMEKCDIEDDLSSDAGEDKIYDEPSDIFNEDVKRYGEAYAKYKARVLLEEPNLIHDNPYVHCSKIKDLDEESVEGYKEDSDDGFYYGQDEDTEHFRDQYRSDSSDEYSPD
ncbi:probable RNA polymerase II nuclear localization protein SLC7A6OS [Pectinophora gossypiella]|uniref:Probable RNA polymerase II nuclear localization protein SLC7A6OS n=1 Tax=Pectinophora gossypiella TaxID=13191 RepID=A0A1E1W7R3_PECGO|nr:probable RNA polymerase II nuclear localization protein SLC7A6OS [Pectinophora gossypiella]